MGEQGKSQRRLGSGQALRWSCRSFPCVGDMERLLQEKFQLWVCFWESLGKTKLPIRRVAHLMRMGLGGRLPWYPCYCIQSLAGSSLWNVVLSTKDGLLGYAPHNGSRMASSWPQRGKTRNRVLFSSAGGWWWWLGLEQRFLDCLLQCP